MTAREKITIFGITELKLSSKNIENSEVEAEILSQTETRLDKKGDREMDILQKFNIQALIYKEIQLLKPPNRPQRSENTQEEPTYVNMTRLIGELKKALTEYTGSQSKFADIIDIIRQINDGQ